MKIDLLNSIGRVHCIAHSWAYSRPIHAHTVTSYTNTQYSTFLADRTNGREHIGGEANAVPYTQQALTQLDDVIYAFLVDPLLHYSPDFIIHGVHIWAVWGPLVGRNKVWHLSAWKCDCVTRPVRRCTVLLEYEIVTRYFLDAWQQLLLQQYFTIVAVNFHSRLHKNNSVHPSFGNDLDYSISYKSNVVQLYT